MKIILAFTAVALLQGCAAIESRQYLHALANDPDCSFQGKPAAYSMPDKCGRKSYGGTYVSVIRTGPNSFMVNTIK
jgi:hypothetical protein